MKLTLFSLVPIAFFASVPLTNAGPIPPSLSLNAREPLFDDRSIDNLYSRDLYYRSLAKLLEKRQAFAQFAEALARRSGNSGLEGVAGSLAQHAALAVKQSQEIRDGKRYQWSLGPAALSMGSEGEEALRAAKEFQRLHGAAPAEQAAGSTGQHGPQQGHGEQQVGHGGLPGPQAEPSHREQPGDASAEQERKAEEKRKRRAAAERARYYAMPPWRRAKKQASSQARKKAMQQHRGQQGEPQRGNLVAYDPQTRAGAVQAELTRQKAAVRVLQWAKKGHVEPDEKMRKAGKKAKKERLASQPSRFKNMTPQQKAEHKALVQAWKDAMTPERRAEYLKNKAAYELARNRAMDSVQRAHRAAQKKASRTRRAPTSSLPTQPSNFTFMPLDIRV